MALARLRLLMPLASRSCAAGGSRLPPATSLVPHIRHRIARCVKRLPIAWQKCVRRFASSVPFDCRSSKILADVQRSFALLSRDYHATGNESSERLRARHLARAGMQVRKATCLAMFPCSTLPCSIHWTDNCWLQTVDAASSSPVAKRLKTGQEDVGNAAQSSGMVVWASAGLCSAKPFMLSKLVRHSALS